MIKPSLFNLQHCNYVHEDCFVKFLLYKWISWQWDISMVHGWWDGHHYAGRSCISQESIICPQSWLVAQQLIVDHLQYSPFIGHKVLMGLTWMLACDCCLLYMCACGHGVNLIFFGFDTLDYVWWSSRGGETCVMYTTQLNPICRVLPMLGGLEWHNQVCLQNSTMFWCGVPAHISLYSCLMTAILLLNAESHMGSTNTIVCFESSWCFT